jgi:serine/threonine-protein kinase HipA
VSELLALIEGQPAARIRADKSGRLSLEYEREWRDSAQGYPLSVNMPLAPIVYPHKTVSPYLWNLLPENPNVLDRWAQQYHVSANNPFKLLTHVGADVPGAAQFIPPERYEEFHSAQHPQIQWMNLDELTERLRQLREDTAAVRRPGDIGKMSLPGAQAKTAYYRDPNSHQWGIPGGRTPTTHIIKPCIPGFDGIVENEHLCQDIASRLGMAAARSSVLTLDETYIVVERYDRLPPPPGSDFPQRIHQEDLCQALGLMPARKYQEDGGPNIAQIVTLIRRVSSDPEVDVERFLKANIFNWLIGGTDAHTKNYSLLIAPGDEVRLAPLYDLSSQLPYPDLIAQRVAMKIGEHYDIARVGREDWQEVALACAMAEETVLHMLGEMAESLPNAISSAHSQAVSDGIAEKIVTPLSQQLTQHVRECLAAVTTVRSNRRPHGRSRKRNQ